MNNSVQVGFIAVASPEISHDNNFAFFFDIVFRRCRSVNGIEWIQRLEKFRSAHESYDVKNGYILQWTRNMQRRDSCVRLVSRVFLSFRVFSIHS